MDTDKELSIAYEPDYEIVDKMFAEPFVIMKSVSIGRPHWWGDKLKVEKLIDGLKKDFPVEDACIQAGISKNQYTYFCHVHPTFLTLKARLTRYVPMQAMQGIVNDVMDPEGARARMWYLERREPHRYGRDIGAYTPPPADAVKRITAEAFLDKDGNLLVSKQMAEVLDMEDNGDNKNQ